MLPVTKYSVFWGPAGRCRAKPHPKMLILAEWARGLCFCVKTQPSRPFWAGRCSRPHPEARFGAFWARSACPPATAGAGALATGSSLCARARACAPACARACARVARGPARGRSARRGAARFRAISGAIAGTFWPRSVASRRASSRTVRRLKVVARGASEAGASL